ncbi:MAG: sugar kinase [Deltaproteobacteria bacterium]|nr:sugar kinase [Deltaproteobacteria bacterium]MBW2531541.1 sugar kinase [Deltaproteobacteria bacterium]
MTAADRVPAETRQKLGWLLPTLTQSLGGYTLSALPILIVGSMAFDDLEFPIPVPDPTDATAPPRQSFTDVVGGAATYASLCASTFAPVRVVAVVGEDFPDAMLATMTARGIDTEGVERAPGLTFRWKGRYRPDFVGRDTLDTQLNVFADFQPRLPTSYGATPIALLGNIHPALQLAVLEQLTAPRTVIADTMNLWLETQPEEVARLLPAVDILVINDEEARILSGIHNITLAAEEILKRGPKRLIIKRGEFGCLYFDDEGVFAAPALPLELVADPTGAGDSFAGGLAGYLAAQPVVDHRTMRQAIAHGTATASFCVQAVGTGGVAALTTAEVAARVAQLRALVDLSDGVT